MNRHLGIYSSSSTTGSCSLWVSGTLYYYDPFLGETGRHLWTPYWVSIFVFFNFMSSAVYLNFIWDCFQIYKAPIW